MTMNQSSGLSDEISDREVCRKAIVKIAFTLNLWPFVVVTLLKMYCRMVSG